MKSLDRAAKIISSSNEIVNKSDRVSVSIDGKALENNSSDSGVSFSVGKRGDRTTKNNEKKDFFDVPSVRSCHNREILITSDGPYAEFAFFDENAMEAAETHLDDSAIAAATAGENFYNYYNNESNNYYNSNGNSYCCSSNFYGQNCYGNGSLLPPSSLLSGANLVSNSPQQATASNAPPNEGPTALKNVLTNPLPVPNVHSLVPADNNILGNNNLSMAASAATAATSYVVNKACTLFPIPPHQQQLKPEQLCSNNTNGITSGLDASCSVPIPPFLPYNTATGTPVNFLLLSPQKQLLQRQNNTANFNSPTDQIGNNSNINNTDGNDTIVSNDGNASSLPSSASQPIPILLPPPPPIPVHSLPDLAYLEATVVPLLIPALEALAKAALGDNGSGGGNKKQEDSITTSPGNVFSNNNNNNITAKDSTGRDINKKIDDPISFLAAYLISNNPQRIDPATAAAVIITKAINSTATAAGASAENDKACGLTEGPVTNSNINTNLLTNAVLNANNNVCANILACTNGLDFPILFGRNNNPLESVINNINNVSKINSGSSRSNTPTSSIGNSSRSNSRNAKNS